MTDLREAFRSLADDEPSGSRIDPDSAVRASRARSRTRRHRWLAGGVAAALVVGVGAVIVGPRLAPGSSPAIGAASRDSATREDVAATVERAAQALRDLDYDPDGDNFTVAPDKIRWSFTFPDPDAPADDPTSGGTGEPARLTVVLRPDDDEAGSLFCDGPSCGGLVLTQAKATGMGYGQTTQDNGDAQQVLERTYADGGLLQLVATGGMQGGRSGGVIPGHPLMAEQLTAVADAIGDPTPLFASDLPLPDPSVSPADWGDGRIDCSTVDVDVVHLPTDAGTIRNAYTCMTVAREVTGDGTWLMQVVRRIDGDLSALQSALEPEDAPPTNEACTDEFDEGPPIWVVTDTGSYVVRVPLDGCGHAVDQAVATVEALPTTLVGRDRVRQLESQVAAETGCPESWKDMLRIEATAGDPAPGTPVAPAPSALSGGRPWLVCRYLAEQLADDVPVGTLVSGRTLSDQQVARVDAALAQATYDPTCARDDHTSFAALTNGRGDGYLVALDGCAVQEGWGWWRAPDELRTLLS